MQIAGYSALAVAFGAAVALSGTQSWLARPWLTYLGRRSYALYLLHPFVFDFVVHTPVARSFPLLGGSSVLRQLALLLTGGALTVLTAELSWRFLESPFLSLKRFVPRPR